MSRITIDFETENDTFKQNYDLEIDFVLKQIKGYVNNQKEDDEEATSTLRDLNGNCIGTITIGV